MAEAGKEMEAATAAAPSAAAAAVEKEEEEDEGMVKTEDMGMFPSLKESRTSCTVTPDITRAVAKSLPFAPPPPPPHRSSPSLSSAPHNLPPTTLSFTHPTATSLTLPPPTAATAEAEAGEMLTQSSPEEGVKRDGDPDAAVAAEEAEEEEEEEDDDEEVYLEMVSKLNL